MTKANEKSGKREEQRAPTLDRVARDVRKVRDELRRMEEKLDALAEQHSRVLEQCRVLADQLAAASGRANAPDAPDGPGEAARSFSFEQLLVAQQRTNELLELAIGTPFDAELA